MHTPLVHSVPQFTITPTNVTVIEGVDSEVQVCVSRIGGISLARDVTVTVGTGPKRGANDQASGR